MGREEEWGGRCHFSFMSGKEGGGFLQFNEDKFTQIYRTS
jgi:hypothetical protein